MCHSLSIIHERKIQVEETVEQNDAVKPEDDDPNQESTKQLDDARHINATVETEKNELASPVEKTQQSRNLSSKILLTQHVLQTQMRSR